MEKPSDKDIRSYCVKHAHDILVETYDPGSGQTKRVPLSELPEGLRQEWIQEFVGSGILPQKTKHAGGA